MYKRSKSSIFMMGVFGGAVFRWYGLIEGIAMWKM